MLNKKTNELLQEIREKLEGQEKKLKQKNESIAELKQEIAGLKSEINDLKAGETDSRKSMEDYLNKIKDTNVDFVKIVNELRNAKNELNNKVREAVIDKFSKEIMTYAERVKSDVKQHNELRETVNKMLEDINQTRAEVEKLQNIGKNIKQSDFELAKYAKTLTQNDKEKLRLMEENNRLKKLVGQARKNKY